MNNIIAEVIKQFPAHIPIRRIVKRAKSTGVLVRPYARSSELGGVRKGVFFEGTEDQLKAVGLFPHNLKFPKRGRYEVSELYGLLGDLRVSITDPNHYIFYVNDVRHEHVHESARLKAARRDRQFCEWLGQITVAEPDKSN